MVGSAAYAKDCPQPDAVRWAWGGQMKLHEADLVARSQYNELLEEDEAKSDSSEPSNAAECSLEQAAE